MKKLVALLIVLGFLAIPLHAFSGDPVNVASKDFTEQVILGKIMVNLLKNNGIPVKDRSSLGGTNVNREALEQGQIDVYMEYTGTAWMNFFKKDEVVRDSQGLYEKVKAIDAKKGLIWLTPAKFNNTYAIVMSAKKADDYGIKSLSDWAAWVKKNPGKMTVAVGAEFYSRADGFKGMMEYYGLTFGEDIPDADVKKMEIPLAKKAVRDSQVLCGMAFATDGEIKAYDGGIQVLMLTGVTSMNSLLQSFRFGAEACLFKPLNDYQPLCNALEDTFRKIDRWWDALEELSQRRCQEHAVTMS